MWKILSMALAMICAGQSASAVSLASASVRADAVWSVTPPVYPSWPHTGQVPHVGGGDSGGGTLVGAGPSWGAAYDHHYEEAADRFSIFAESAAAADTGSATGTYAYAAARSVWTGPPAVEELHLTISYDVAAEVEISGRPTEFGEAMVDFSLKLLLEPADMVNSIVLGDLTYSRKIDQSNGTWWNPTVARFYFRNSFDYTIDMRGFETVWYTPPLADGSRPMLDVLTLEMSAQVQTLAAVVAPVPVPPALPMAVCGLGLLAAVRRLGRSDRFHPA